MAVQIENGHFHQTIAIIQKEIAKLFLEANVTPCAYDAANRERRKQEIISKIEMIMLNVQEGISNGEDLIIELRKISWENCYFKDRVTLKSLPESKYNIIRYSKPKSKTHLELIVFLISKIYKILLKDLRVTKRQIYYQNLEHFKNPLVLYRILHDCCLYLDAAPWELGIVATSKGLVAGALSITHSDDTTTHCNRTVTVPDDIPSITNFQSSAKFILIVEKDTVFQKLITSDLLKRLGPLILITAKGYPDVNTRLFVRRLWTELMLPIFALVDCDPFGIEIMCVYRFGSLNMSYRSECLAVPAIRWIGVMPTEIESLILPSITLTERDQNRLQDLLKRPYITEDIRKQLEHMVQKSVKAEVEALDAVGLYFLSDFYLRGKICSRQFC